MNGIYYKGPINFQDIIEKRELEKTNLEQSIAQFINLVVTSSFGECKFDELFGCRIWEIDFDLLIDSNILRDKIKVDIKEALEIHERRLEITEVDVAIGFSQILSYNNAVRIKKKVSMQIVGFVKKTNRPFNCVQHFFVGPLSYS